MFPFDVSFFVDSLLIFVLAFLIDIVFGEIPDHLHPTVWMGSYSGLCQAKDEESLIRRLKNLMAYFYALVSLRFLQSLFSFFFGFFGRFQFGDGCFYIIVGAILLKTTFALKCMRRYTFPIEKALRNKDIGKAREWLHFIVRRDPNKLDERHIISAAVESIAESTTDGVTSPFFFFRIVWCSRCLCLQSN